MKWTIFREEEKKISSLLPTKTSPNGEPPPLISSLATSTSVVSKLSLMTLRDGAWKTSKDAST
jgi:hypothetical protein